MEELREPERLKARLASMETIELTTAASSMDDLDEDIANLPDLPRDDEPEGSSSPTCQQNCENCCSSCWTRMRHGLADFCGLTGDDANEQAKWQARSGNLATTRLLGGKQRGGDQVDHPSPPEEEDDEVRRRLAPSDHILMGESSRRMLRPLPKKKTKQDSVLEMLCDGIRNCMRGERKSIRKPNVHSRSIAPSALLAMRDEVDSGVEDIDLDDTFFDTSVATSLGPKVLPTLLPSMLVDEGGDETDSGTRPRLRLSGRHLKPYYEPAWEEQEGWRFKRPRDPEMRAMADVRADEAQYGQRGIDYRLRGSLVDNSDRWDVLKSNARAIWDRGIFEKACNVKYKKRKDGSTLKDHTYDHRPYFTYWLTFVQVLIYIVSVSVYGIAPFGIGETQMKKEIIQPNLALELVDYYEKSNFWIGPRQADLIHLGAKFAPCMRKDKNIDSAVMNDRAEERKTACCINNDGSGCLQSPRRKCSVTLSTWLKWDSTKPGERDIDRIEGSVCGQDPLFCDSPPSIGAHRWPDNLELWPICYKPKEAVKAKENRHMTCELLGRPCCIGVQGQCVITTSDVCDFRRGHFHEEATLCSQVSCMDEICGMLPFANRDTPDQFYRLWTCLFLHAGLIHLIVSILFNFFVLRRLEKMAGWIRITVIFLGSGLAGSLASGIFLPYHVESGPSGAQFGILACQLVWFILKRHEFHQPGWVIGKLLIMIGCLFILGFLPMIDNYAHLFGFLFGFLVCFAILPFAKIRHDRIIALSICTPAAVGLAAILIVFFYATPVYDCPYCHYFTCIPFTENFCKATEFKIARDPRFGN